MAGIRASGKSALSAWTAVAVLLLAGAAQAEPVSAAHAREALAAGAIAWDVRAPAAYAQGHLPGAVSARVDSLDLAALEALVSARGIDLSRGVVVYGLPGDEGAARLHARLESVSPGKVYWLVGGLEEWQLAGGKVSREVAVRAPVPQRLVVRDENERDLRMAAHALRRPHPFALWEVAGAR